MCLKWSCGCTTGIGDKHWGLNLHKALSIQIAANAADYLGTLDKSIFNVFIHDQIDITLTITSICVSQSMIFLRKDLQTLRQ